MDMVQAVNNFEKNATISENMWGNDIDEMNMVQAVNNFEKNATTSEKIWENDIDEMDMIQVVNIFEKDDDKSGKSKSMIMNATTPGFKEVALVFKGLYKNFFNKNNENIMDYKIFLKQSRFNIRDLLFNAVQQGPLKYL